MANFAPSREISDEVWENKEHEWTGKSFYFVNCKFIFGNAIGLDGKLEALNRDLRTANYKVKNPMVLIEHGKFNGRIMIEVEKKDNYDSQLATYDVHTVCDTKIHYFTKGGVQKGFDFLKERVAARRSRDPRQLFYMYQPDSNAQKTILFALT